MVHCPGVSPRPAARSSPRLLRPTLRPPVSAASAASQRRVQFASEPYVQQSSASGSNGSYASTSHTMAKEVCAWAQGEDGTVMMQSPPGSPGGLRQQQQQQRLAHHQDARSTMGSYAQQQQQQLYETMSWAARPQCSPAHSSASAAYSKEQELPPQQQAGWEAAHQPTYQECQQPLASASHQQPQQQRQQQQQYEQQQQQQQPARAGAPRAQHPAHAGAPCQPVQLRAGTVCITVSSPRVELAGPGAAVPSSPHQLQQRTGAPALQVVPHAAGSQGTVQVQKGATSKTQGQQQSNMPATADDRRRDGVDPLQALQVCRSGRVTLRRGGLP